MTTQMQRDLDKSAKLTADVYMISNMIAIGALFFQIPYLTTLCVWFFWVLGVFGGLMGLIYYTKTTELAATLVHEGAASKFIEDYDGRYKSLIFQASWIVSLIAWYLFYLRGHVWLAGILVVGSVVFEISKYRLRKKVPDMMAAAFVWQAQKLFTGEGEDDDYRT